MARAKKLTELELRKQSLLLDSDLNRRALSAESGRLRESVSGAMRIFGAPDGANPLVKLLAPVAGMAIAAKLRSAAKGSGFIPQLLQVWRSLKKPRDPDPDAEE